MRILGLDVGDKTIGVAVSDELLLTAQNLTVIKRVSKKEDFLQLKKIIEDYNIGKVVVGLPKNMNGTIGERGETSISFAEKIKNKFGIPIELWDERLTTVSAERVLLEADLSRKKRKEVIDKVAASFILQSYLDAKR